MLGRSSNRQRGLLRVVDVFVHDIEANLTDLFQQAVHRPNGRELILATQSFTRREQIGNTWQNFQVASLAVSSSFQINASLFRCALHCFSRWERLVLAPPSGRARAGRVQLVHDRLKVRQSGIHHSANQPIHRVIFKLLWVRKLQGVDGLVHSRRDGYECLG